MTLAFRLEMNMAGFKAVRTDPNVLANLQARASRIASAAGVGFATDSEITGGRGRARAVVYTGTFEAKKAEAVDQSLTRAIDAGRG